MVSHLPEESPSPERALSFHLARQELLPPQLEILPHKQIHYTDRVKASSNHSQEPRKKHPKLSSLDQFLIAARTVSLVSSQALSFASNARSLLSSPSI
jgi:hypothetical protein